VSGELERPAPPYRQIADAVRDEIRAGDLAPGDRIPSVRELVQRYDVAMATAHRAVRVLQAEGYIRTEAGIGNVVTTEAERGWSASSWVRRARRTGRIYPPGQHARILSASIVAAPEQVAGVLAIPTGEPAIQRVRVTYEGDHPVSWSTSWFSATHADVAPRLLETARILEGTFTYLGVALGRSAASWQDQYDAAIASVEDVELLGLAVGSPVHRGRNWVYDAAGEVLEYGESVSAARITYRGEVEG
jgi:DNA-binding GntR family transcriptional regulator